jgi:biopolymer transport protein ExbB/TolQ
MEIMALFKTFIYLAASSLLVPVLLVLSVLIIWMLVYCGRFTGIWLQRCRLPRHTDTVSALRNGKYEEFPPEVWRFAEKLDNFIENGSSEIEIMNLLRETEHTCWQSLDRLKILIRVGPGLGLIGTLIPMGTGLAALGQGNISRLSGDLVIAFTTTVVGMTLGLLSYLFFTVQRRWAEEDIKNMELLCELKR